MLKLIYKWHKWIGVSVGVILAMWLFTGIIMVSGPRPPIPPTPRLDFSAAVISPAQASAKSSAPVTRIDLIPIGTAPVYKLSTASGTVLVDARSGELVVINDSLATVIARLVSGVSAPAKAKRLGSGEGASGYRVVFSDEASTVVEIEASGAARVTDKLKRFRNVMGGLHTFGVLRGVNASRGTIEGMMILIAGTALVSVVTGYVMALPRRRHSRVSPER
ncbi:MAG TPA: PepSY domain-containing protein [Gemmatimonadales bacterium]|nr:PepSY domain-containing protein [Gemmatimonadales bacterium]